MREVIYTCDRCGKQELLPPDKESKSEIREAYIIDYTYVHKNQRFPEHPVELCQECRAGLYAAVHKVVGAYLRAPAAETEEEKES